MMIELYRSAHSEAGANAEHVLKELVLAHRVVVVEPGQSPEGLPPDTPLPALKDEGQIYSGEDALKQHLRALEIIVDEWRKYQSDSCYIDSDGNTC